MRPCTLAVFEEKLAANLLEVAAFERFATSAERLEDGLDGVYEDMGLHVFRLAAQIEGACHTEMVVEFARGVGVDGEGAAGGLGVHGDEFGAPTTDDGYEGGCGQREEVVGFDGRGDCAEVFLAVLWYVSSVYMARESLLTPQKKCRMKMISCLEATCGALYSSLKGLLWPCASNTSRSSTLLRSLSVGMSLLTSTVPSNSSCSFCKTGVWLEGENGGVMLSAASTDNFGSAWWPVCEWGGEGSCVVDSGGAEVAIGAGTSAAFLLSDSSMVTVGSV